MKSLIHSSLLPAVWLRCAVALAVILASLAWCAPAARAATITVDTETDENNSDGDCALREAVIAANQDSAVDACPAGNGADTIRLPAGTFALTLIGENENASATGDLDIDSDVTIIGEGKGDTDIDANGIDRVFHVLSGTVLLARLTMSNGDVGSGQGGGLQLFSDVTVEDSRIRDNIAGSGGGIYVSAGSLTLIRSRVDGNSAEQGGGILSSGTISDIHITDSLISGNTATQGSGGGVFNSGTMSLSNSTVNGNSAVDNAGGILNVGSSSARVIMFNVTVANNTADSDSDDDGDGGGIYAPPLGRFDVRNSVFANNRDRSVTGSVHPDCSGDFFGVAYNLIENVAGCTFIGTQVGDVTGVDPMLDPLRDNGGPTLTRALLAGSPAIDAGNPAGCIGPNGIQLVADQRGALRNGVCDIGAFEFDSPGTPTPTRTSTRRPVTIARPATATPTVTQTGTRTHTPTITRTLRPTGTRTPTPSGTATQRPTRTASITASPTRTVGFEASPTERTTRTRPPTRTATRPATATHTRSAGPSPSVTITATPTRTRTATASPPSVTGTATSTRTVSSTPTPTAVSTVVAPASPTAASTATPAVQKSATGSPSASPTASAPAPPTSTAIPVSSATPPVTPTSTIGEVPIASPTPTPTRRTGDCQGDCDGNATVAIDELVRGIRIALDAQPVTTCPAFDSNGSAAVEVEELIAGVNSALRGCE